MQGQDRGSLGESPFLGGFEPSWSNDVPGYSKVTSHLSLGLITRKCYMQLWLYINEKTPFPRVADCSLRGRLNRRCGYLAAASRMAAERLSASPRGAS